MQRPISIGLSPNIEIDDQMFALKTLFKPGTWIHGEGHSGLKKWFNKEYPLYTPYLVNAGRSGLYLALKAFGIDDNDEVLLQAFTCVAVPNSIVWTGAKPVFVDIDKSLNFSIADAQKKLTPKTRAVIVQHTFGIPAELVKIKAFCVQHNLVLIEDCAHALGAEFDDRKVGSFGDASIFSFGRDKVVSSVFGGAVLIHKSYTQENKYIENKIKYLSFPSRKWTLQQLLHPISMLLILPFYNVYLGKIILVLLQKISALSFPVYDQEKRCEQPGVFPSKMPNALCVLALHQLGKLSRYNERRIVIARKYFDQLKTNKYILPEKKTGSIYLRFNILSEKAAEIRFRAGKKGMIFGRWYSNNIDPKGVFFDKIGYREGSCPRAEKIARTSLNLPTYPTLSERQVSSVISFMKSV